MKLSVEEIKHIADLAKIKLNPEELERFGDELSHILEHYGNQIQEVDTDTVDLNLVGQENVGLRQDEVRSFPGPQKLVDMAPESKNGLVRVPRTLKDAEFNAE